MALSKIHANAINLILRREWAAPRHDREDRTLAVGRACISGLTDEQLLAVAQRRAELRGNNVDGVTYHEFAEGDA